MGRLHCWHVEHPPPFAFVTPDQQVQPFGKSKLRQAHAQPLNLRLDDIAGSRPKQHCFPTSPRLTDPLEPQYIWPLREGRLPQAAAAPSKFLKNSLDNSDIPGAQASPRSGAKQPHPNFRLDCSDVDGAAPGWQPDWKLAARARHAQHRPATAPSHTRQAKAARPTNFLKDIEKSSPWHPTNAAAHQSKVHAANAASLDHCSAQQLLQQKIGTADPAAVAAVWRQLRQFDREACGIVSSKEFATALQHSSLGFSNAEVLKVSNGLADCNGLMEYRPTIQTLQANSWPRPQSASVASMSSNKPPLAGVSSLSAAQKEGKAASESAKRAQHAQHADSSGVRTQSGAVSLAAVTEAAADSTDRQCSQSCRAGSLETGHLIDYAERPTGADVLMEQPSTQTAAKLLCSAADVLVHDAAAQASGQSAAAQGHYEAALAQAHAGMSVARSPGPAPQKVPYFFSKGHVNMDRPYKWVPSGDNSTIAEPRGHFQRPWTAAPAAGHLAQMQASHRGQGATLAINAAAGANVPAFFNDSQRYIGPRQNFTAVDVTHRDSPQVRRQKGSLLEDMMTIKRL